MFRIAQYSTKSGDQRPALRVIESLPAYETKALAEKIVQRRLQQKKIFFLAAPWFVIGV